MNGVSLHIQQLISSHGLVRAAEMFARSQNLANTPDGEPALVHVENVHRFTRAAGLSRSYCACAWLHDLPVNGALSTEEIGRSFGAECAALLEAITIDRAADAPERRDRQVAQLRRCPWAIDLKLADMLAHVSYALERRDQQRLSMYSDDHAAYAGVLQQGNRSLFAHLQSRVERAAELLRNPAPLGELLEQTAPGSPEKDYYRGKNLPSWVREVLATRGDADANPYLDMLRKRAG